MKDYEYTINNAPSSGDEEQFVKRKEMRYRLSPEAGGIKVNGKIVLPVHASAFNLVPGAVLCHGFGADQNVMESSALLLGKNGIATIVFDLRGHGLSEGCLDGNFGSDVIDAWKLLTSLPEIDGSRIALIGHSLGALSSILAAKTVKPKALVALSCPYEMKETVPEKPSHKVSPWARWAITLLGRLVIRFNHLKAKVDWGKCLEYWPQVKLSVALAELDECDKLFVFSKDDMITPYKKFARIYEDAPEPKQKMLTRGSHSTPVEAEILRFEWVGWVVSALTTRKSVDLIK
jgi:pimeloyl-ACP methyl ester carboxylesterase